jgi:hypothetical protein
MVENTIGADSKRSRPENCPNFVKLFICIFCWTNSSAYTSILSFRSVQIEKYHFTSCCRMPVLAQFRVRRYFWARRVLICYVFDNTVAFHAVFLMKVLKQKRSYFYFILYCVWLCIHRLYIAENAFSRFCYKQNGQWLIKWMM